MELGLSVMINLKNVNLSIWNFLSIHEKVSMSVCIGWLITIIVSPPFMAYFVLKNKDLIREEYRIHHELIMSYKDVDEDSFEFRKRYGSMVEGCRLSDTPSLLFNSIFMARRFMFCFVIVYLIDYPTF